jgi:DNA replication protein DnaC
MNIFRRRPMLANQTLNRLRALKLHGLADAFAQQLDQPPTQALSFEERFALLLEREVTYRENRRLRRLLRAAKFRQQACIEDIDYRHHRGLDRSLVATLVTCDWVRAHHNLHVTGPTGCGKSWLACAFGNQACRQGLSVRYERTGRLLDQLRIARGDGSYQKMLRQLARMDLLILDDFGLKPLPQNERHDLLEVIEDRHGLHSTLITSQLPISAWHEYLNEPTVADALLDRLLNGAHRLELSGDSMRKKAAPLTKAEAKR